MIFTTSSLLPYCLAATTKRLVLLCDARLLLWCQASCAFTYSFFIFHHVSPPSMSGRSSAHPQSYFSSILLFFLKSLLCWEAYQKCDRTFRSHRMLPPASRPTKRAYYFFTLFVNGPTLLIYELTNAFTSACRRKLLTKSENLDTELITPEKSTPRDCFT